MLDGKLLRACMQSRKDYMRVQGHIAGEELSPQAKVWWQLMEEWYKIDAQAHAVDKQILRDRGKRGLPEKHAQVLLEWFDALSEVPSSTNVVREALDIKLYNARMELARVSANPDSKQDAVDKAMEKVAVLAKATDFTTSEITLLRGTGNMEDFEMLSPENMIQLAPKTLNSRCDGGAVGGDHIVVFGPTEIGKSLFTINMSAHFLRNNHRVLYIGNEDRIHKIRLRIKSNLSNMTKQEMKDNPDIANSRAEARGMTDETLLMAHMKPGFLSEINELADRHKPKIIVLDQFRNLGGKESGITQRMNDNAIEFRSIIARHDCVGLSVAQAHAGDTHGKPKVWYEYSDIDSSRTGLPAQADLLVAIGADEEMLKRGLRAISICKNKLGDDHEGFMAQFDHAHSRVIA